MNCELTRRRLLTAEHPARPGPDVKRHLAACPACRAWQQGLAGLEAQVALLPVPPSDGKRRLLKEILAPAGAARAAAPLGIVLPMARATPPKERGLRKLSLAVAVAAAALLFAVGLSQWPSGPGPGARAPRDYGREVADWRDGHYARAHSPRQRVEAAARFADDLLNEARALARAPEDADKLAAVAREYARVVREDLMAVAQLPAGERGELARALAPRLGATESEFQRLLAAPDRLASADAPLREIADAARNGERRLRELAA